jgi:hypothetical protein
MRVRTTSILDRHTGVAQQLQIAAALLELSDQVRLVMVSSVFPRESSSNACGIARGVGVRIVMY